MEEEEVEVLGEGEEKERRCYIQGWRSFSAYPHHSHFLPLLSSLSSSAIRSALKKMHALLKE